MNSKRILYVIGSLEVGGAEQHLVKIATSLKRRGWEPEIFTLAMKGPLLEKARQAGILVSGGSLPAWLGSLVKNRWLQVRLLLLISSVKLFTKMWFRRPTVVHFFLPTAYVIGGVISLFSRVPIKIMSRRSMNEYQKNSPLQAKIERWLHGRMTYICGNSQAVIDQLALEGVSNEKLFLIYNGIELADPMPQTHSIEWRRLHGISANSLLMVVVANLIPYKGHQDLVKALGIIKNLLPEPWDLLCLGRDDGIGKSLLEQSKALGVANNVHFLGSRSDVPKFLMVSDIGILCSHEEGFSNAVLECMAYGLPMVVTNVGGNSEAVLDGRNGYVVEAGNAEELASAVLRLAQDPERRKMGETGRRRVLQNFTMDACVNSYEEMYREAMSQ